MSGDIQSVTKVLSEKLNVEGLFKDLKASSSTFSKDSERENNPENIKRKVDREIHGRWDNNLSGEYSEFAKDPALTGLSDKEKFTLFAQTKAVELISKMSEKGLLTGMDPKLLIEVVGEQVAERFEKHRQRDRDLKKTITEPVADLKDSISEFLTKKDVVNNPLAPSTSTALTAEQQRMKADIEKQFGPEIDKLNLSPQKREELINGLVRGPLSDPELLKNPAALQERIEQLFTGALVGSAFSPTAVQRIASGITSSVVSKLIAGQSLSINPDEMIKAGLDAAVKADKDLKPGAKQDLLVNTYEATIKDLESRGITVTPEMKKQIAKELGEKFEKAVDAYNKANNTQLKVSPGESASTLEKYQQLKDQLATNPRAVAEQLLGDKATIAELRAKEEELKAAISKDGPGAVASSLMKQEQEAKAAQEAKMNEAPNAEELKAITDFAGGNLFNKGIREKIHAQVVKEVKAIDDQIAKETDVVKKAELEAKKQALLQAEKQANEMLNKAYASWLLATKGPEAYDRFIKSSNEQATKNGLPIPFGPEFKPAQTRAEWAQIQQAGQNMLDYITPKEAKAA
jgi:hypothetical protein